MRNQSTLDT